MSKLLLQKGAEELLKCVNKEGNSYCGPTVSVPAMPLYVLPL